MSSWSGALTVYNEACRAVEAAKSIDVVLDIRAKADALRLYARQAQNRSLEMDALEIRLRAERRVGQILSATERDPGGRPERDESQRDSDTSTEPEQVSDAPLSLAELGIDRKLSARAQKMAALGEDEFLGFISEVRADGESGVSRVTKRLLDRISGEAEREPPGDPEFVGGSMEDLQRLVEARRKFRVIYADPPSEFVTWSDKGKDRSPERHYDTMPWDEIEAMPLGDLAADDALLMLWATHPTLPHALDLLKAWGFEYVTVAFTWVKQNPSGEGLFMGPGYWTRANPETVLLGARGNVHRLAADVHSVLISPVMEHSRKPEEIRARIERLVAGPYLELFARRLVPGWVCWGNEIKFEVPQ